jgi:glyoxylase-like metal-dependent hydrolase (beta-lactamase superfamily II)
MSANTIRIGNVEITAVADAAGLTAPCNALFPDVHAGAWEPHRQYLGGGGTSLHLSITSFLVRSAGKTIIIDTGIGAKDRPMFPNGRLPGALAELGVAPDSVDIVANTHMHVDHVGWHTTRRGEAYVPTFPKARHLFNKDEWAYFTNPAVANAPGNAHIVDSVLPLQGQADVDLVSTEHQVTAEITLIPTPGHTPAHQSFVIASAGEKGIIWGDVCHNPAQITELWSPVFDMDPALSRKTREHVVKRIEEEKMRLVAGHFPFPGFGGIVRIEGKRYWRAG